MTDDYLNGAWRLNGRYFYSWNSATHWLTRKQGWRIHDAVTYLRSLQGSK